jgi:hypothetical protein
MESEIEIHKPYLYLPGRAAGLKIIDGCACCSALYTAEWQSYECPFGQLCAALFQ